MEDEIKPSVKMQTWRFWIFHASVGRITCKYGTDVVYQLTIRLPLNTCVNVSFVRSL